MSHKFLELRDRFPLANRLFTELIHWDAKGNLAYFNPNPIYPADFRPINPETFELYLQLTDEELRERLPTEFAHTVSQILDYQK